MKSWNDITLANFQRIGVIRENRELDDLDVLLFSVCELNNVTEFELDNMAKARAEKLIAKVGKIFNQPFIPRVKHRIGPYRLHYDPAKLTLGQFVELMFFVQKKVEHAHYILASISTSILSRKYNADTHRKRADYFLQQPIEVVTGCINQLSQRMEIFKAEYKGLFGVDSGGGDDDSQSLFQKQFNQRYGWTYSAREVADYEKITLEEAYQLPVRQALNDLMYLKQLRKYENELLKKQ